MSTKNEPTVLTSDSIEETQSIGSVDQMYDKFIRRIDSFRSIASSPNLGINTYRSGSGGVDGDNVVERANFSLSINPEGFLESRAHAFYRMIGFPVASPEGSDVFYNPGHDPQQINTIQNRRKVNTSLNSLAPEAVKLSQNRETQLKKRLDIFIKQDELSSIYGIMLSYPKPFLMAKVDNSGPFDNDPQTQPIAGRKEQLQSFRTNDIVVPKFITDPEHVLKPFIINPDIESAVTEEYKRRICVPFLPDKTSTKTTQEDYLKRPIIEYIIRQRLKISDSNVRVNIAANRAAISNGLDEASNREIISVLFGETSQFADFSQAVNGLTSVQASSILVFTKAIRVAVAELDNAVRIFKGVRSAITIQPIPTTSGPEFGGTIRTVSTIEEQSETDRKIAIMELMQIISEDQSTVEQDDVDIIGDDTAFASAEVFDVSKNFTPDIKKLSRERDAQGKKLLSSLRLIEIITGEIAGLGLIDVLAAYTALWAIDMRHLIGFLDTRSLERIQNNFPKLINDEIQKQLNGDRPSITETLQAFERLFFNVLAYADATFAQSGASPKRARKGSIT